MIEVTSLTKYYGTKLGIEDLTFEVAPGEIVGFLGPNAAGKTTTMRILTGFMPPSKGTARVAGFDVLENPMEVKRRIGYLPENPPLYREMVVNDYLRFVAELKEVPLRLRRGRVDEVIEMTQLGSVRNRLIQNISRGYKQRVGLAQALLNRPEVLILDEPTVGLDPKQIIEIRNLIKSLAGEHTVILSSHILPEVSMTCNRVMIINSGRLVAEDTPDNLALRLRGSQRLCARILGPAADVLAMINSVAGVQEAVLDEDGREDPRSVRLEITADQGDDVRERLFYALAGRGWPLIELHDVTLSLEQVFLQLTTEEESEGGGQA